MEQVTLPKFSGLKFENPETLKKAIEVTRTPQIIKTTKSNEINLMDSLKLFNILQHGKSLYKSVLQLNKLPQTEIIRRNKPAPLNYLLNQPSLTHSLSQEKLTILGLCLAPENYGLTIPEIQTIFKINVRYIRSLFTPTDYRKPCAIGDDAFNIRPDLLLCQKLGCIYQPTAQFEAPWCFADTTGWF